MRRRCCRPTRLLHGIDGLGDQESYDGCRTAIANIAWHRFHLKKTALALNGLESQSGLNDGEIASNARA